MNKYILLFLILILSCADNSAQPNGGFENWSTEFNYEEPDEWQTFNLMSLATPPNPLSVFKALGSDKHSGNYALKIKSVYLNHNVAAGPVQDTFGCAFKGLISISPITFKMGYPYTGRPEKLEFYSKYFPVGNDTASVSVLLKKWTGSFVDTIAAFRMNIVNSPIYSKYEVNLDYRSNDLPDSAVIAFFSSRDSLTSRVGSTLFVDDVLFTGWVGIDDISATEKLKAFPNPAKEEIMIRTTIEDAYDIRVVGINGNEIGIYLIENQFVKIDTRMFAEATYFYEIRNSKNKTLGTGKFSVVK